MTKQQTFIPANLCAKDALTFMFEQGMLDKAGLTFPLKLKMRKDFHICAIDVQTKRNGIYHTILTIIN